MPRARAAGLLSGLRGGAIFVSAGEATALLRESAFDIIAAQYGKTGVIIAFWLTFVPLTKAVLL
jgi:hypothetical protein